MTCKKMEVLIYQFEELSLSEKTIVEIHVQTCTVCQILMEQVKQQQNLIRQAITLPVEERNAALLTNKIMSTLGPTSNVSWWIKLLTNINGFMPRVGVAIASCLLVIFFAKEFYKESFQQARSYSTSKASSTLNTQRFLHAHWKRKELTVTSVSFYQCLKREDCAFKKLKINLSNENI